MGTPIMSIVVPTYNRPKYLRTCLEALTSQTSREFEVIVVCNGSPPDIYDIVAGFTGLLPDLKVIPIEENIWSWNDFGIYFQGVYKPGLDACSGQFVLFLSDDDAISEEFVERILRIFQSNPECVAVTGTAINRNLITGEESFNGSNLKTEHRPMLEDGKMLSLKYFSQRMTDRLYFSDPGFGYVVRTSLYGDEGLQQGIWKGYEVQQYLLLLPHGVVGFDHEATFFWGRHPDQANLSLNQKMGMLRIYMIDERAAHAHALTIWHSRFGADWAQQLEKLFKERRFPRNLRFIGKTNHPHFKLVETDVRLMVRNPHSIKDFYNTDARETIFWVLLPRALTSLFLHGCQRSATAIRAKIK